MTEKKHLLVVLGSTNPSKILSVKNSLEKIMKNYSLEVIGVKAPSGVRDQPMSDEETLKGAENRAKSVLAQYPHADFAMGIEGGISKIGDVFLENGFVVVLSKNGEKGIGTSGSYQLSSKILNKINEGTELGDIVDELSGEESVKTKQGAMGLLTKNLITRDKAYETGIIFAFSKFYSDSVYWH
ncbi:hypothetical protein HK099_003968 [Clydaea vesicula]|uniref:inosine/xanthosine triphosphatase n=1 Tax=Clydaea vesicula TaxID=447962 RepID=A0AAD5U721_9FUNG|nr:hypothetical protein HK099_003968 [Clydaea vesicula]